ncbi:OprO/OprP family phosphate-selective porin [uncultured Stenotrophomonas sp.]|uniref:OprO/OprP family phosphate-selective porin n=1 Tax=uncultured Stenotrophomonas sp. TaxID=165438 RepID=UPI0025E9BEEC|nr:OprO/OprP family phosphate-selective porin [uncultured Stenotrophomonas sp.]
MKLHHQLLTVAVAAALYVPAAHAEVAIDVIGGSEITFEGLVQADGNWFDNDVVDLNGGDAGNGKDSEFELRRAELVLKGKGPGNVEWVVGYDAKADKFLDTNVKYKLLGNANHFIQAGQFKQPNSLEELSSTKNNDFISKAAVTNTYAVARRLGGAYSYGQDNWSVTASAFGRELTRNLAHGSGYGARGTFAPINEKGQVLHFGLSYVDYDTDADTLRVRARPNADLATARLVDSGNMVDTDRVSTLGAEAMYFQGPFKAQAEYYSSKAKRYAHDNYKSDGYYVSGVWNVTGETWSYKGGTPGTGLPNNPAGGQWQLGVRYDHMDLNDGNLAANPVAGRPPIVDGVLGGKMDIWTVGANWYWRSNFKFMVNYVMVDSKKYSSTARGFVNDDPNILEARAQFFW